MRRHAALIALLVALAPSVAAAEPSPGAGSGKSSQKDAREAKKHFDKGTVHYNLQEWDAAIEEYKEAYRLSEKPKYLWALAQAQRLGGDCAGAIQGYKAFLRSDSSTKQRELASEFIDTCEATIEEEKKKKKKKAQEEAERNAQELPPEPPPPAAPPPETTARWYTDVLGHALFFGGVTVVAAGSILLIVGNGEVDDANQARDYATFVSTKDSGQFLQTWGGAGLVVGTALVAGGVLRYVMVGGSEQKGKEAAVSASIGPQGLEASLSGHF